MMLHRNNSAIAARRPAHLRAFTLTEMLVALAVMVLAMAMVTTVFSVTTKTAATSAAIADVEAIVRNVADQLQQDLEYCDPSRSILAIQGRTQAAGLTEENRLGGQYYRVMVGDPQYVPVSYDPRFDTSSAAPNGTAARDQFSDPRADILMFFSERPTASRAPALTPSSTFQDKLRRDARLSPIQVVYGHAAIDTAVASGGGWTFANNLTHIETGGPSVLSDLPATRWHLARRVAILDPNDANPMDGLRSNYGGEELNRVARCYSYDQRFAGDAAHLNLSDYLSLFAPGFTQWNLSIGNLALLSPYQLVFNTNLPPPHNGLGWQGTESWWVYDTLFVDRDLTYHHVATVIEQPPAELADNLGVHLAPGCVWFQVEFLMPEDPRNGLEHPLSDQRRDTPRWVEVDTGQTYVFVPDTLENRQLVQSQVNPLNGLPIAGSRLDSFARVVPRDIDLNGYAGSYGVDNIRVRMWPYAIRITVRVIDQRGRLEEPIVRSVVHRFD